MALMDAVDRTRRRAERRIGSALRPLPEPRPEDPVARAEHAAEAGRLRRASLVALFAWPAFGLVDLYIVLWVQPGRLWLYWLLRFVGLLVIVPAVVRLQRHPAPSRGLLRAMDVGITTTMSLLVTVSCVELGGIASPLALGIITILLARSAMLSDQLRRAALPVLLTALAHPVGLMAMALFVEDMREQLRDPTALAVFVLHQIFVLGAAALTLVGGHVVWSLRRQVFESRSLGRYALRRKIGEGGMGEVWSAIDKKLDRAVAVKLLRPRGLTDLATQRFEREIRATCDLAHPNTVRVFDHGITEDGVRYYVMELLEGLDLADLVDRQGAMPVRRAVELVRQTASALAEAHDRHIVHRDLKPENIFVARIAGREFVKVLDFGLAHAQDDNPHTQEGCAAGSPNYIAPEILRGYRADARSDVYALGCVLYFALCGRAPFAGRDVRSTLLAHLSLDPPSPSVARGRRIPERVERIVLRCLRKDPHLRYGSARELVDALTGCVQAKGIRPLTEVRIQAPDGEEAPTHAIEPPTSIHLAEPPTTVYEPDDDVPTRPKPDGRPPPQVPRPRATVPPIPACRPNWAQQSASAYQHVTRDVMTDARDEITAVDTRAPAFH